MLFVKAAKVIAISLVLMPIAGCAIGTGILFASLVKGLAYAPDHEESLFNFTAIGFAFIESFMFILLGGVALIYAF